MIRPTRVGLMHFTFALFAVALVGRSAQLQLFQTERWRAKARVQQIAPGKLPAPRGAILDVTGGLLVESRQLLTLAVAPREVAKDIKKGQTGAERQRVLRKLLVGAGVAGGTIARTVDTTRSWVPIPGNFPASDVTALLAVRGVHADIVYERIPPTSDGLRRLIGRADGSGAGVDGLEKALDHEFRGIPGHAAVLLDSRGRKFESPAVDGADATPGNTVTLTINQSLQDIAERSLSDAIREEGADGGDIVILDPATGEVRALASRRPDPKSTSVTALTEPYEPGSTLKPFVAARLLDLKRARTDEMVNTWNGEWELNGRKISDEHKSPAFSLADVIRFSSNIGIVQFASRFSPREQYELLRDLGFGTQTGLPYPAEESGRLPSPQYWDKQTPASLAMGYALNVTPMQLAAAYGAIANGGELLEPSVIREIRAPDGTTTYRHARRVVRRVMSEVTARTMRDLLRGVVEGGTAEAASLATFDVAGKTGTAKRTVKGHYVAGKYTASFVGFFPADHPQLVILVKLDNPVKSIFGGKAAAPVSRKVLLSAIAGRETSLDRKQLALAPARARPSNRAANEVLAVKDSLTRSEESGNVPYVFRLDAPRVKNRVVVMEHPVPSVQGLPLRRAVYTLHRAGFRVTLAGSRPSGRGAAGGTSPGAGTVAPAGTIVRLALAP